MKKCMRLMLVTMLCIFGICLPVQAGDTIQTAANLPLNQSYKGSGKLQFYKMKLSKSGKVDFHLSYPKPDKYYASYIAVYTELDTKNYIFSDDARYSSNTNYYSLDNGGYFDAGTYYVKVCFYDNYGGNYDLRAEYVATEESYPESLTNRNDYMQQAPQISFGSQITGQISYGDKYDFYKFVISSTKTVQLNMRSNEPHLDYVILTESEQSKGSGYAKKNENLGYYLDQREFTLDPGTYYIRLRASEISGKNVSADYIFSVDSVMQNQSIIVSDKANRKVVYKKSKVNKKAQSFKIGAYSTGTGTISYKVTKYPSGGKKYISVNRSGKVTIKKKAKKGTYKVTVTAAQNDDYYQAKRTITIQVK